MQQVLVKKGINDIGFATFYDQRAKTPTMGLLPFITYTLYRKAYPLVNIQKTMENHQF
jgi:hypothetical protein